MRVEKIRILHCIRQGSIGGGESHVLDLVGNLNSHKFESFVLAFSAGAMIDRLMQQNITNAVIETNFPFDFRIWNQIENFIKTHKIDIIHAHGTRALSNIYWARKKMGVPVIYTVHGWSIQESHNLIKKSIRILSEQFLTKRATLVINVSDANQETGKKYIPNFKSIVIKNGVNLEKFNPTLHLADVRSELGISHDSFLVGYIARITEQKNPIGMVDAFNAARLTIPNLALLVVGAGDKLPQMKERVNELMISKHVYFTDFRLDIPAVLKCIDVFCLPSLWEGLPIGILEAMAMGKAVIATNVDGTKEIIVHNMNGILVNSKDVNALAAAIITIQQDNEFRKKLEYAALQTIEESFNVSTMANQIEICYQEVLQKNKLKT